MKTFFIIIIVFAITVGGILFNRKQVNTFIESATDRLSLLNANEATAEEITAIESHIHQAIKRLEFSIPRTQVNAVRNYATLLVTQYKSGDFSDFEETRQLLIWELLEISETEQFSFSNIF